MPYVAKAFCPDDETGEICWLTCVVCERPWPERLFGPRWRAEVFDTEAEAAAAIESVRKHYVKGIVYSIEFVPEPGPEPGFCPE
jgi:hypothetical protein